LSLKDDDRVNARKDLSQRVKTHAEVTRTPSTTKEEDWHVEIAVAVYSHPEGFERYIVGDPAGRESLHSSPQRNEQSQQGDLISGYADDLAQVDCDCESRLLVLDGLSCSAERFSTERARDGDGWFVKHETHERLWPSDRGFKCYHGSRRVPNEQEPFHGRSPRSSASWPAHAALLQALRGPTSRGRSNTGACSSVCPPDLELAAGA
jgi:hypothetical protein